MAFATSAKNGSRWMLRLKEDLGYFATPTITKKRVEEYPGGCSGAPRPLRE